MRLKIITIISVTVLAAACGGSAREEAGYDPARDFFSFATTRQFLTRPVALDLTVDFDANELRGSVAHSMRRPDSGATEIVLDSRDLVVSDVQTTADSTALRWPTVRLTSGGGHPLMFSPLPIIHSRRRVPLQDPPAVMPLGSGQIPIDRGSRLPVICGCPLCHRRGSGRSSRTLPCF